MEGKELEANCSRIEKVNVEERITDDRPYDRLLRIVLKKRVLIGVIAFILLLLFVLSYESVVINFKLKILTEQTKANTDLLARLTSDPAARSGKSFFGGQPQDCHEIWLTDEYDDQRNFIITPTGSRTEKTVRCLPGGWTVILSRGQFGNTPHYFKRGWKEYTSGFGEAGKEFWLGLEQIYQMTKDKPQELKIILEAFDKNETKTVHFQSFQLGGPGSMYSLNVTGFSSSDEAVKDDLSYHNGMGFSTQDWDNDNNEEGNCAKMLYGGWWYNNCLMSKLTGINIPEPTTAPGDGSFKKGIIWYSLTRYHSSLKSVQMAIKPK